MRKFDANITGFLPDKVLTMHSLNSHSNSNSLNKGLNFPHKSCKMYSPGRIWEEAGWEWVFADIFTSINCYACRYILYGLNSYCFESQLVVLDQLAGDSKPWSVRRQQNLVQPPPAGERVEVGAGVDGLVGLGEHLPRHPHTLRRPTRGLPDVGGAGWGHVGRTEREKEGMKERVKDGWNDGLASWMNYWSTTELVTLLTLFIFCGTSQLHWHKFYMFEMIFSVQHFLLLNYQKPLCMSEIYLSCGYSSFSKACELDKVQES